MLPQLERQYLQANLAQAEALLAEALLEEDDPISRHQWRQQVNQLQRRLDELPEQIAQAPAGLALFFGGRPVFGSVGIQANFGSKAIERFQLLVSQRFAASELGPLASKGRVPLRDNTHLLVTDVVRGSFGFVLQAAPQESEPDSRDSKLKSVVDKVADTLSRVGSQDEGLFDDAVAEIDERQKTALTEFFKLLDVEGATMRIVEGERDFELDRASVQRARQRVESMQISDEVREVTGLVVGWTDFSARFELRPHDSSDLIQGAISREALESVEADGFEPYHKHVRASMKVRKVAVRNRLPKTAYTLLSLEAQAAPGRPGSNT